MPLIQVKLIEGVFDADEKEAIIEKLTDAMVRVEGEAWLPQHLLRCQASFLQPRVDLSRDAIP